MEMELPATQQVLKVAGPNKLVLQSGCPLPTLEDDEVLVRVWCVSVNPVDAKMLDLAPHVGATAGCEFAGDVVAVGVAVRNQKVRVGVAVFGCIFGNNTRVDNGAYAAYLAAPGDLVWLLPPHLSYAAGASLSAAMFTVGLAIYSASAWPLQPPSFGSGPSREAAGPEIEAAKAKVGRYVLVYGASTVSGALALQMLRLSNISTIAVSSSKNFKIATERGADATFDYHDPSCADDIRRHTGGSLAYALDCIADLASMKICYAALGSAGGRYTALNPFPLRGHTRRDVRPDYVLCYTIFGKPISLPRPFGRPARPKDRAFAEAWCESTQKLVDAPGVLLPHPISQHSGLAEISAGLDYVRQGKVSATKLVYEVSNM